MNKKILVFVGIFILILVALFSIILRYSTSPKQSNSSISENSANSPSNNPTINNSVTSNNPAISAGVVSSSATNDWKQYSGDIYSLKYPQNWTIQDESLSGYKIIKLSPVQNGNYDPISPFIKIIEIVNSTESLKQREEVALNTKIDYTQKNIGGKQADFSSSIINGPVIDGQSYGKLQTSVYYLESNNIQFIIQTSFSIENTRQNDKNTVNKILSSLKII